MAGETNYPPDLDRIIGDLQRRISVLETAPRIGNTAIDSGALVIKDASGNIVSQIGVFEDGSTGFEVYQANGTLVARIGTAADGTARVALYYPDGSSALYSGSFPDGRVETILKRDDGSTALRVGGSLGFPQFVSLVDRAGNIVVSDDTTSGRFLARPWLPFVVADTNVANWFSTTAGTWTTIAFGTVDASHPKIYVSAQCWAATGVTGQFRMRYNGNVISGVTTVSNNNIVDFSQSGMDVSPYTYYGSLNTFDIQAQVTAGAGTIAAQFYGGYQRQS